MMDISVEDIIIRYQGFEEELVSYYVFDGDIDEYNAKLEEYQNYKRLGCCFILHMLSNPMEPPTFLKEQADKMGYDVGFCDEETEAIYSSIFHEILFGHFEKLIAFKDQLNKHFLFPTIDIAKDYVHLHDEMSEHGEKVEDIVEMTIYEIWKQKE